MSNKTVAKATTIGDLAFESKVRADSISESGLRVYGVDRADGLTPDARYTSKDLGRYKVLRPGMFAYNPMRLNIGSIAYCTDRHALGLVSPDYVVFGCKPGALDPDFFSYAIKGPEWRQWTAAAGVGSVRVRIYYRELAKMPITVPPFAEQKKIAHILGTLDDKIELNRQMNATLAAMARTLFQSWFMDFDPVRAKLDGREPAGLDTATAVLFPAQLQDSLIGHIPQGWEVRSLDQIAHFLNGLALQKYPAGDGATLPVIKIAQLRKGDSEGADRCNTELSPQYIVEDGEVLFSWSGSLEVELWCGGQGALNQHLFKVTSPEFPKWFYYLWTLYHLDEFRLIAADKATTMGHIQRGHLTAAKVLVPPPALLKSMTNIMAPLIDQIIANRTPIPHPCHPA